MLRGGWIGDEQDPVTCCGRSEVPRGESPTDYARERASRLIAESNDEIGSAGTLAFSDEGGIPVALRGGKKQDWGVSLFIAGGGLFVDDFMRIRPTALLHPDPPGIRLFGWNSGPTGAAH